MSSVSLDSWVEIPSDSDFTLANLPYGIFSVGRQSIARQSADLHSVNQHSPRVGVAIGTEILDLALVAQMGFFDALSIPKTIFAQPILNDFIALGKATHRAVRTRLIELLSRPFEAKNRLVHALIPQAEAVMHLPVRVGDYTDFYASEYHATNVGSLFRPNQPLMPNWKRLPVAYHGRASSMVVSGTDFYRPSGQFLPPESTQPIFGPSQELDFELELAAIVGKDSELGQVVSVENAEDYVFGFVLLNDWSARDLQRWEYQPLGPFLGKNFCTTLSPWIVPIEALDAYRIEVVQPTEVLPYLSLSGAHHFEITLEAELEQKNGTKYRTTRSNAAFLYWSFAQMLAHHTVNGCPLRIGDVLASGTVSGPTPSSLGCLLELTQGGKVPLNLPNGASRKYLLDGDAVTLRGFAGKGNQRVGFGTATGRVLPSWKPDWKLSM